MQKELMLKLKRSKSGNHWERTQNPLNQAKRHKAKVKVKAQSERKRERPRVHMLDSTDSDDSWCADERRIKKRKKGKEKRKKSSRWNRIESSDDSDWLSELMSDSETEAVYKKTKKKPVDYKLSDEDFRSNYAFLLNDDKLLEDPVVKLYPVKMDGPVYIVKDHQSAKVKMEPQDVLEDIWLPGRNKSEVGHFRMHESEK